MLFAGIAWLTAMFSLGNLAAGVVSLVIALKAWRQIYERSLAIEPHLGLFHDPLGLLSRYGQVSREAGENPVFRIALFVGGSALALEFVHIGGGLLLWVLQGMQLP